MKISDDDHRRRRENFSQQDKFVSADLTIFFLVNAQEEQQHKKMFVREAPFLKRTKQLIMYGVILVS